MNQGADVGVSEARPRGHPEEPCRNCSDPTRGEYCPTCGQRKVDVQVSVADLVRDLFEDQFGVERRTPATLFALLFRPGHLTREYLGGRIVRYIRPLKLYLVSSVVLFLLVGFFTMRGMDSIAEGYSGMQAGSANVRADPVAAQIQEGFRDAFGAGGVEAGRVIQPPAPGTAAPLPQAPVDTGASPAGDTVTVDAPVGSRLGDQAWFRDLTVNTGSAALDQRIRARVDRLGRMEPADAVRELLRTFLGYVPTLLFLLLPVFAGILKLLYIRTGTYYAEHFIFVLHTHAFVFGTFSLALVAAWAGLGLVAGLLQLWAGIYIFLALRRVYGQGHLKTAIKYWTLGWMYFWVLLLALVPVVILTLLVGG
ncbi:MAG: DUF3667 domain-containing protein [Gemmatimonadales bacterium]|nr:MAG: DUF3667 domain-containing protein [Gemmatimonadales bacterium]